MTLDDHQTIYKPGAILGCEQFLRGDPWTFDLISKSDGCIMAKYCYSSYMQLKDSQPTSAINFMKRLVRNMTYQLIYSKKNNPEYYNANMKE